MENETAAFEIVFCGPERVAHKKGPSKAQWEAQRERISRMYREENKTLRDVMAILRRDHVFEATEQMYKKCIRKWGLDKKNKKNEVRAILRKKKERDAEGKDSNFKLRGRSVDIADVLRYARRKGLTSPALSPSSALTPTELVCFEPETIPPSPTSPQVFMVAEQLFVHVQNYVRGSFENGSWVSCGGTFSCVSVKNQDGGQLLSSNDLYINCSVACRLLDSQSTEENRQAVGLLSKGMAVVKDILDTQEPYALIDVFGLFIHLRDCHRTEIQTLVLGQLSNMSAIVLPLGHPLRQIWAQLSILDTDQFRETLVRAWKNIIDAFGEFSGPLHYNTLKYKLMYIRLVERGFRNGERQMRKLLSACEQTYGAADQRSIVVRRFLGWDLCSQKRYAEAEDLLQICVQHLHHGPGIADEAWRLGRLSESLSVLSAIQYLQHKLDSAISNMSKAIDRIVAQFGWEDAVTIDLQILLERWLNEWGKSAEAAEVRQRRLASLRTLTISV